MLSIVRGKHELHDKTLGIIGYGRLGKMVEHLCKPLFKEIISVDKGDSFDELYEKSDVVSIHMDYNPTTEYMINNEFLSHKVFLTSKALSGINFRADNIESFENLEKNSIDFYASVKSLYLQDRENKIKNSKRGNIEVIFEEDQDWEEIDSQ